jgi:hypothetical protein
MAKLTDTQLMVLLEGGGARRRNSKHSRRLKQSCRSESRGKPRFSQADARGAVETCPFSIGAGCCQALSDFLYRPVVMSVAGSALLFGIGTEALP